MKKAFCLIFMFVFLNGSTLVKGDDYLILKNPFLNAKNSVIEIFSYQCIFCFNHHKFKTLSKIKEKIPNLNYYLIPVSSMAKNGKEFNEIFAYAQYLDIKNGKDSADESSYANKIASLYFKAHFEEKKEFDYDIGLKELNISKSDLDSFLSNNNEIFKNYDIANDVAENFGTPTFIVNGKYQINPEKTKTIDDLINMINELKNYE